MVTLAFFDVAGYNQLPYKFSNIPYLTSESQDKQSFPTETATSANCAGCLKLDQRCALLRQPFRSLCEEKAALIEAKTFTENTIQTFVTTGSYEAVLDTRRCGAECGCAPYPGFGGGYDRPFLKSSKRTDLSDLFA